MFTDDNGDPCPDDNDDDTTVNDESEISTLDETNSEWEYCTTQNPDGSFELSLIHI